MKILKYLNEEWRNINGFRTYMVSNFGRVKRKSTISKNRWGNFIKEEHLIEPYKDTSGYLQVKLYGENGSKILMVHRLVAFAFPEICGEWFDGAEINHKDENPANNYAENLEWCNTKYNNNYGNRKSKCMVSMLNKNSKTVIQYSLKGEVLKVYPSAMQASRETGFCGATISYWCRNNTTTSGYLWKYAQ